MLLAHKNKLLSAHREVQKSHWDREAHRGSELRNRTIGVYGYGHTGSSFVKLLQGFGVNVLVYDKYKERYADNLRYVTEVDETSLVSQSDILSFHLPLTTETRHLVNAQFLKRCKRGIAIINTSRGQVVNTADLLSELKSGQVSGACLDVIENEKPHTWTDNERAIYNELWSMDQVIGSPHVAGWTQESKLLISEVLWKKIKDISWPGP
ncbi:UNVERIFIED_CONTAM: hypothetical protein GTU68_055990 [Idotea baltica]|nr:hypothetical protein [Idotea baltica]